jgi:hypothetical protein
VSAVAVLQITAVLRPALKAHELLKHNIDALLRARGQTRPELARWCRRSRSWLDKAFSEERREIPLKYLDRIADFFGIATYQLFQPGISPLTERRAGTERRRLRDRRMSAAMPVSQRPGDVDLMDVIRALSRDGRERAIQILGDILSDELQPLRTRAASAGVDDRRRESGAAESTKAGGKRRKIQA